MCLGLGVNAGRFQRGTRSPIREGLSPFGLPLPLLQRLTGEDEGSGQKEERQSTRGSGASPGHSGLTAGMSLSWIPCAEDGTDARIPDE